MMALIDSPDGGRTPSGGVPGDRVFRRRALVSLVEIMRPFKARLFLDLIESIPRSPDVNGLKGEESPLARLDIQRRATAELSRRKVTEYYAEAKDECLALGLDGAAATLEKIVAIKSREVPVALLDELYGRLLDGLRLSNLLALTPEEATLLSDPRRKWEAASARFSGAILDIDEASKCLAMGRYTACVFHLMRVIEIGLRALGSSLNDPDLDPRRNPTWDAILKRLERELAKPRKDRSPEWKINDTFFSTATAQLRAIQFGWRNPTLHVERDYGEEETRAIYSAVRVFMNHLAQELGERGGPGLHASEGKE